MTENTQRILSAATSLFAKHGYHTTTIRDIAILANVNEITVYRQFRQKEDLFWAVLEDRVQRARVEDVKPADPAGCSQRHTALLVLLLSDKALTRLLLYSVLELENELSRLRDLLAPFVHVDEPGGCDSIVGRTPSSATAILASIAVGYHVLEPFFENLPSDQSNPRDQNDVAPWLHGASQFLAMQCDLLNRSVDS